MRQDLCARTTTLPIASSVYPRIYPSFAENIQQLGANGLMSISTEKEFQSTIRKALEQYLQTASKMWEIV
ncbi:4-hydroxyphenylacetate 3-hydroxylase C-terminal domain-containing protein [Sporosarcina soli]|uniref:4-hydroxyphenylacetate 3-hydroxylase C-terminal domain-containing protein n=1 Tax=Sporosarcina soli TaxID=334736 RepID=A0ABW0TFH3_9BACL